MGRMVSFESNWTQISGYLAEPADRGPGVIVIHEWWGLNSPLSNIRDLAFAPDFYKGESADNPEDAGRLMTEMFQQRMEEVDVIFRGSVEYLRELEKTDPLKVGVTGFCCGGTLSMYFASKFPELVDASVPFYGLPQLTHLLHNGREGRVRKQRLRRGHDKGSVEKRCGGSGKDLRRR